MLTFNYIMDICQVAHLWNLLVLFEQNFLACNDFFLIASNLSVTILGIMDFSYHSELAYGIS